MIPTPSFPLAKRSLGRLIQALCAVLLLAAPAHRAQAWWNDDFTLRKKITLDPSAIGAGDPLGAAVVLIRLYDGNFQFAAAREDGSDVRFIAGDDKTPLAYHFEKYDSLMSEAFAWVRIPDLKAGTPTTIWIYYGAAGTKAAPGAADEKGTYGADTALVYHFAERGAPAHDASGHGNHAREAGIPVGGALIGPGLRLNGQKAVFVPASASLAWTPDAAVTWSAWVKPATLPPNAVVFSRRTDAGAFLVGLDGGVPFVEIDGRRSAAGKPVAAGSWHHLAVVAAKGQAVLYLDGEAYATLAAALPPLDGPLTLGGAFEGDVDELEIANAARSAGAVKAAAAGQGSEATKFLTFDGDEQAASWMSGTLGVLFKSLTVDGWIVIGLLGVMGIISWTVMIGKVGYLNGISRSNAIFMKEWRHVAADLTVLDHGEAESVKTLGGRIGAEGEKAIRLGSVYRIYRIGAEEIRHRLAPGVGGGARVLSAQSIQAIKATLDTGLIHEIQRLSRLMVVLTIAISGGPFLGLLGTVVGVMITFAAIAQAGDVNVNAIAPGIAAALVATVAGLAVAIPALFGYNYLISRIKDATSDMHVFVDEFVTKMAEFYRPRPEANGKPTVDLEELVRLLAAYRPPAPEAERSLR